MTELLSNPQDMRKDEWAEDGHFRMEMPQLREMMDETVLERGFETLVRSVRITSLMGDSARRSVGSSPRTRQWKSTISMDGSIRAASIKMEIPAAIVTKRALLTLLMAINLNITQLKTTTLSIIPRKRSPMTASKSHSDASLVMIRVVLCHGCMSCSDNHASRSRCLFRGDRDRDRFCTGLSRWDPSSSSRRLSRSRFPSSSFSLR